MASEKNFENKIKKYLDEKGCWYVKFFANRMTKIGVPDLLACVNGCFVAIEVKGEGGKPSELQFYNQRKIREAGGISLIVYPGQFDDLKHLIDDLLERPESLDWDEQHSFDKTK